MRLSIYVEQVTFGPLKSVAVGSARPLRTRCESTKSKTEQYIFLFCLRFEIKSQNMKARKAPVINQIVKMQLNLDLLTY